MIKKLEVEDIAKILHLNDNVTDYFPCDKGEWVQWLIQNVDNPDLFIMGVVEDGEVTGYIVAINSVKPPLDDSVYVLYAWSAGFEMNKKILKNLIDWSKEKNARSIDFVTEDVVAHTAYGFKKKATLMTMELN